MKAVFPGSFDPPTLGHLNVIERASGIFDELVVLVAENRQKIYLFSGEERLEMVRKSVKGENVRCASWDSLIVDYMKKENIRILIRGLRGVDDFSHEFELATMNKALFPEIETFFLATDGKFTMLRSSSIKEIASFHGDVSRMVPPCVEDALKKKFGYQ